MNDSTENDQYQDKGINYKYEGSVILDSQGDQQEAEYLDKVEIEPL
jgi:hypothetical protein